MDYRYIVRATDDVEKRRSCEEDVIAEYNSLESLVLDGWGFEQPSASVKMEWFSMQAEGETNSQPSHSLAKTWDLEEWYRVTEADSEQRHLQLLRPSFSFSVWLLSHEIYTVGAVFCALGGAISENQSCCQTWLSAPANRIRPDAVP